jgi:hypothetical protein
MFFGQNNPLSYFPQGGNGGSSATSRLTPSPLGEGWEGGIWAMKRTQVNNIEDPVLQEKDFVNKKIN